MDPDNRMLTLLLHQKPVGVILSLSDSKAKYASKIAKEIDCTYTHVLKILDEFQRYGIVGFKKEGRIKEVVLTDSGKDIAHDLKGLISRIDRLSDESKSKKG